jgi:acetoin utilization deacetylase AcuC-like enzyme
MTLIVYDDIYLEHDIGDHVEGASRLIAIVEYLKEKKAWREEDIVEPRAATAEEVRLVHTQSLVDQIRHIAESGGGHVDADTEMCPRSYEVALYAVGGVLTAVDRIIAGESKNALCLVRPPGHHATPDRSMGFCLFNNAAVGARYAQKKHGLNKIAIIDWDVHHGNGTQDIFWRDGSVFYFSTHQSPWYPGTGREDEIGEGAGRGTTLNCPLPAGAGRKEIVEEAFRAKLLPAAARFKPDLVLVSAGFDSRAGDPLGGFLLSDEDFADLTRLVLAIAREHARGRLVSVLEGGYALDGLASASAAHVRALVEA